MNLEGRFPRQPEWCVHPVRNRSAVDFWGPDPTAENPNYQEVLCRCFQCGTYLRVGRTVEPNAGAILRTYPDEESAIYSVRPSVTPVQAWFA